MIENLTWNEFCELYYSNAKDIARIHLAKLKNKIGPFGKFVDEDYIIDSAVFSGLQKGYESFDETRHVKVTTFLSTIIHNEIVSLVEQETRRSNNKSNVDNLKLEIRTIESELSDAAREELVTKLIVAIAQLPHWDQVILENYLEDKANYVSASALELGVSENTVRIRRCRIFELLPKLMNMSRAQYLQYFSENECSIFAGKTEKHAQKSINYFNPIMPNLDIRIMAEKIASEHVEITFINIREI